MEGEVLVFARVAVEAHQFACLSEDAGELVHDAAVAAYVFVLCSLSGKSHVPLGDAVVSEHVVEETSEASLQSCRGTHASSQGDVTSKCHVEAFDIYAEQTELLYHAVDVACPCGGGTFRVVHFKFHAVFLIDGVCHHFRCAVGACLCHDAAVYCSREDEASVVVGVLADEVDTTGRKIYVACLAIKVLDETTSYKFDFHRLVIVNLVGLFESLPKPVWQWGSNVDRLFRYGVYELHFSGEQRDAPVRIAALCPVFQVALDGASDVRQLAAYLVVSACEQLNLDEGVAVVVPDDAV